MQCLPLHRTILRAVAALMVAFGLMSCHPLEELEIPQTGYWYVLEIPSTLQFQWRGGSCSIAPVGYIYLDGQLVTGRPLTEDEVELVLVEGNDDFLVRDGFFFATSQSYVNHRAYYKCVWLENGAIAHLAVFQFKPN